MAVTDPFQVLRLIRRHTRTGQEFQCTALIERIQPDRFEQPAANRGPTATR